MGALSFLNGPGQVEATGGVVNDSSIPASIARDSELPTVNNSTVTITAGDGLATGGSFTVNQGSDSTVTIAHEDTSSQASVNNSGSNFIQDITLDTYGHVTGITSAAASSGTNLPAAASVGAYSLMFRAGGGWAQGVSIAGPSYVSLNQTGGLLFTGASTGSWRNMGGDITSGNGVTVALRVS